jgi:hypothetical protein
MDLADLVAGLSGMTVTIDGVALWRVVQQRGERH